VQFFALLGPRSKFPRCLGYWPGATCADGPPGPRDEGRFKARSGVALHLNLKLCKCSWFTALKSVLPHFRCKGVTELDEFDTLKVWANMLIL
jgi:hypothetical protein